jgi:hypothetical protein
MIGPKSLGYDEDEIASIDSDKFIKDYKIDAKSF